MPQEPDPDNQPPPKPEVDFIFPNGHDLNKKIKDLMVDQQANIEPPWKINPAWEKEAYNIMWNDPEYPTLNATIYQDPASFSMKEPTNTGVGKPVKTRTSLFGYRYPVTEKWTEYPGAGWIHESEEYNFNKQYAKCFVAKRWFPRGNMHILQGTGMPEGARIFIGNKIPDGYQIDGRTSVVYPDCDMMDDGHGVRVSKQTFANNYFKDNYDGKVYFEAYAIEVRDSNKYSVICKQSFKDGPFTKCECCGHVFEEEMCYPREDLAENDRSYCGKCYKAKLKKDIILPHNHNGYPNAIYTNRLVARVVKGKNSWVDDQSPRAERLFGWEAEVEVKPVDYRLDAAISLLDHFTRKYIFIKHDGSIAGTGGNAGEDRGGQYGFEIVSAPCDMAAHTSRLLTMEKCPAHAKLRSWDTKYCGFHVHVSRTSLSNLQIGRILAFVNFPGNVSFIAKVAGRKAQKYGVIKPKMVKDYIRLCEEEKCDATRRVAVNLTNPHTVEFRIFRGTIRGIHMIRNLEFCDAVCDYCLPVSRSLQGMFDYRGFIEFVVNEEKWTGLPEGQPQTEPAWPYLAAWMVKSGMAPDNPKFKSIPVDEVDDDLGPVKRIKTDFSPLTTNLNRTVKKELVLAEEETPDDNF